MTKFSIGQKVRVTKPDKNYTSYKGRVGKISGKGTLVEAWRVVFRNGDFDYFKEYELSLLKKCKKCNPAPKKKGKIELRKVKRVKMAKIIIGYSDEYDTTILDGFMSNDRRIELLADKLNHLIDAFNSTKEEGEK